MVVIRVAVGDVRFDVEDLFNVIFVRFTPNGLGVAGVDELDDGGDVFAGNGHFAVDNIIYIQVFANLVDVTITATIGVH